MSFCPICRRSTEDCRNADKLLITPFNIENTNYTEPVKILPPDTYVGMTYISIHDRNFGRATKAVCYVSGLYDLKRDIYYGVYNRYQKYMSIYIKLPICVWEGDYSLLRIFIECITRKNLKRLLGFVGLPKNFKKKINKLFEHKINEYLFNLPTQ